MNSAIKKFYELPWNKRLNALAMESALKKEQLELLKSLKPFSFETADRMVENVIGIFGLPLGVATNFKINGKDFFIPMAIEESSVIAAASNAAKIARKLGGFKAESSEQLMIGQIQLKNAKFEKAKATIARHKALLLRKANECDKVLCKHGGGAKDIEVRKAGKFVVLHLIVDVRDAMGANAVNSMCEAIAPEIEKLCNCHTGLKILSNFAVHRIVKAKAKFSVKELGKKTVQGIIDAWKFACADPFRAVTHNKGIMNGIDAVAIATGNDFRAIEAGAHAFASKSGKYKPLTKYSIDGSGNLVGEIELPVQVGIVGGGTKINPMAQLSIKLLGVKSAKELAEIIASVGLAQNFAALKALATEGIQRGHMKLHAENLAVQAGAKGKQIKKIAERMINAGKISEEQARKFLEELK